jgi:glycosyltransferase involved in cell wall biosynthesis
MTAGRPLVSVGIPTFNRASTLRRAIESVLAQEEVELELVVSDNASTDDTEELCRELARSDARLRYLRQPRNLGPFANFRAALDAARGSYFMWLADDDWLERGYLARCADFLERHPDHALVCGTVRFFDGDRAAIVEPPVDATSLTPGGRVLQYYARLTRAGIFYGLSPTELRRRVPFPDVFASDWYVVAGHAALGGLRTLGDVNLNRALGPSEDPVANAESFGVRPGFTARHQHLWTAATVFQDVAWRSEVFSAIGRAPVRWVVGAAAAVLVVARFWVYPRAVSLLRRLRLLPAARVVRDRLRPSA